MIHRHLFFFLVYLATWSSVTASGPFGGEMRYSHELGSTYRIEALVWTEMTDPIDLPEIEIFISGAPMLAIRTDVIDYPSVGCGSRFSRYVVFHTFPGPGVFDMYFEYPARPPGVVGVALSEDYAFHVDCHLVINPILGDNNSVEFTAPQPASTWVWSTLVHDPLAVDPDGDSLTFELVEPLGSNGQIIPAPVGLGQYTTVGGYFWFDPTTGRVTWNSPSLTGLYSVVIRCYEWRNGQLVGWATRDMSLCVGQLQSGIMEGRSTGEFIRLERSNSGMFLVNGSTRSFTYSVLNTQGQCTQTGAIPPGRVPIELEGLSAGPYFIRAYGQRGEATTLRFTKP
mgnify:CR=1 FL=1